MSELRWKRMDADKAEGIPAQYVGVYVLDWQQEWGKPSVVFFADEEENTRATDPLLDRMAKALEDSTHKLNSADALFSYRPDVNSKCSIACREQTKKNIEILAEYNARKGE